MASDKGILSIEINVTNMTLADFTVEAASYNGTGTQWIKGEEPQQQSQLQQYSSVRWGVMTTETTRAIGGNVALTGYGGPISITFNNTYEAESTCSCTGNEEVYAVVHEVNTGDPNHSQFNVTLEPAS